VVKLSEMAQTLVALAVVAGNNRLLVVETPRGQLELPGLEIGEPDATASRLIQFMSKLGLDQMPRQTLYLPNLRMRKQQATPVIGVVHLVRLAKAQHFEIPNSRYETTSSLAEDETATPTTRAVARWLLQAQG
jgi:hypothetical protein